MAGALKRATSRPGHHAQELECAIVSLLVVNQQGLARNRLTFPARTLHISADYGRVFHLVAEPVFTPAARELSLQQ